MKVNLVTLCSGIEAQGQALRNLCNEHPELEWELVAWSEIDKDAIAAHNAIFPEYADRNLGDMTTCDYSKITQPIDCLFYSTPCQSVSQAVKNKGMKEGTDAASALIWHTRRAIESLKPKICILENVKGMIMGENLREFHKWQAVMESYGYTNYTKVLDSKDYGVAQHRERVFMVSILGDEKYHFPEPFKLEKRIKDYLEPYGSVPESFYLTPKQLYNVIAHCEKNQSDIKKFGRMNSSQDGIIVTDDSVLPCIMVGHGNVPKVAERKEPAIIGYTRSRDGKITSVHLKDTANTIHTFTGSGFTTDQYVAESALFNPMPDGTCRTLKAQYARSGAANFARQDGFGASGVIEPVGTDRIIKLGRYREKGVCGSMVLDPNGIAPSVLSSNKGMENAVIEPSDTRLVGSWSDRFGVYNPNDVCPTLMTNSGGNSERKILEAVEPAILKTQRTEEAKRLRREGIDTEKFAFREYVPREDGLCNTITTFDKDNLVREPIKNARLIKTIDNMDLSDKDCAISDSYNQTAHYDVSPTITTRIDACNHYRLFEKVPTEGSYSTPDNIVLVDEDGKGYLLKDGWIWRVRKLTPPETFRLQGVSDEDAKKIIATVSKSACYSLAGNSITVDVLYYIFLKLFIDKKNDSRQPSLFDI